MNTLSYIGYKLDTPYYKLTILCILVYVSPCMHLLWKTYYILRCINKCTKCFMIFSTGNPKSHQSRNVIQCNPRRMHMCTAARLIMRQRRRDHITIHTGPDCTALATNQISNTAQSADVNVTSSPQSGVSVHHWLDQCIRARSPASFRH